MRSLLCILLVVACSCKTKESSQESETTTPPRVLASHNMDPEDYTMTSAGHWLAINCPLASHTDGMQSDVLSCAYVRHNNRQMICTSTDAVTRRTRVELLCDISQMHLAPSALRCGGVVYTSCR